MLILKEEKPETTESASVGTECPDTRNMQGRLCANLLGWIALVNLLEQF
jgi:hypothetical protein